jgi:cytochrome c oxidase cbb3-type subunit 3
MSNYWSAYVIFFTVITSCGSIWLLLKVRKADADTLEGESLDHKFDGIQELNNPLPRWWLILYISTFVFGIGYLILYPGFGNFPGVLNWSSEGQLAQEKKIAQEKYGHIYTELANKSVEELLQNEQALQIGQRIFLVNCIACHGSDARGSKGYPNLTDSVWLYGNSPEQVKHSIANGRKGMMPPFGAALGEQGITEITAFLRSLNGQENGSSSNTVEDSNTAEGSNTAEDSNLAKGSNPAKGFDQSIVDAGQQKFATFCVACHGQNAQGNIYVGAPNLRDDVWLYGGSDADIRKTLNKGRSGNMPAHAALIDVEKIHILSAYVISLAK